jgi:hypothetical protein
MVSIKTEKRELDDLRLPLVSFPAHNFFARDANKPHHFVSDFPSGPVADRALFWLFTSQGDHLVPLLCGNLRWSS